VMGRGRYKSSASIRAFPARQAEKPLKTAIYEEGRGVRYISSDFPLTR
jgi:hypothetical protein